MAGGNRHSGNLADSNQINPETYWDFGGEREPLMHRIHAYPAKFPAFITPKAVTYAQERGVTVNRIADIFCGCGTTALEAKRLGTPFWGCDINPVATLIARVKSEDYQPSRLVKYAERVIRTYDRRKAPNKPRQLDDERMRYWYDEERIRSLARLKSAIETLPEGKYRDFFLCAFSNILKPTSRWLTKSIKPQVDPNKVAANVREAFEIQVGFMIKAAKDVNHHAMADRRIITGNFLDMSFSEPFVDLIITSPPYVTSYEYADLHQLSTLWLDYTDDYRKLRRGTIGSLYHDSEFMNDVKQLNAAGSAIVFRLYDAEHRKARATARYFVDMHRTVKQCRKALRPGGMVLFVIGNTEYKGVKVDNAAYLRDCLSQESFTEIETTRRKVSAKNLTPYRDTLGRFTADATSRQVYSEEFVVTGRCAC
ncbi:MAG TPA: class I SAM-dependent methyltransferase [Kiritimatiellia bacterium]|nr:class I SAM-dependent methyltransferase [Kiritimatiellia bacterium]HMP33362.1 class I SAM-dependent methyltransferase [Kiritimatiellia bacterium]